MKFLVTLQGFHLEVTGNEARYPQTDLGSVGCNFSLICYL